MVNTTSKGNRVEWEFKQLLEKWGYSYIEQARRRVVKTRAGYRNLSCDFFGCFDFLAVRPDGVMEYFQVKSNASDVSLAKKKIREFRRTLKSDAEVCYVFLKKSRKGWVKYVVTEHLIGDYKENYDLDGNNITKKMIV